MIIILILVALLLVCIALVIVGTKESEDGMSIPGYVVGVLTALALLITSIALPLAHAGDAQGMTAFYHSNQQNYEATEDATYLILSEQQRIAAAFIPIEGSIERMDVGSTLAQRIVERRQAVNSYNVKLTKYRYFSTNAWTSWYYPRLPQDLKLITIVSRDGS